jgi:hypothetical protein
MQWTTFLITQFSALAVQPVFDLCTHAARTLHKHGRVLASELAPTGVRTGDICELPCQQHWPQTDLVPTSDAAAKEPCKRCSGCGHVSATLPPCIAAAVLYLHVARSSYTARWQDHASCSHVFLAVRTFRSLDRCRTRVCLHVRVMSSVVLTGVVLLCRLPANALDIAQGDVQGHKGSPHRSGHHSQARGDCSGSLWRGCWW